MVWAVLQIMIARDQLDRLVLRADRLEHFSRIAQKDALVGAALDHQRRDGELRKLLRPLAFRRLQAPHREPALQRVGAPEPEAAVRDSRIAAIAARRHAIRWID